MSDGYTYEDGWIRIPIENREHSLQLNFADKKSKYFAYIAVSLTGPKFDKETQVHMMHEDKVVKLTDLPSSCIHVKYPLDTYFLLEFRHKINDSSDTRV